MGLPWIVFLGSVRIATNQGVPGAIVGRRGARQSGTVFGRASRRGRHGHWPALRGLLDYTGTAGNLRTEAHLAACAIARDATLVSCDSDFAHFEGLRWKNPLREAPG